jgi:hypothetical protein
MIQTSIWTHTTTPELRSRLLARIAATTALLVQTALIGLAYYLMHLALDMADLWLELANTHLALTS